jgi:hypothetical protein
MRHHRTLAFAAALLFALGSRSFAQPCSEATVRGTWAFQGRGTTMVTLPDVPTPLPAPFVTLGTLKIDNQGRYTAHGTAVSGAQIQDADWSGSIQVNPDCTATDTYMYGSLPSADRFVILDNGNEMRAVPTKFFAGPTSAVYSFRRISSGEPHCTGDMVRGVYGGSGEGTYLIPVAGQLVPTPYSAVFSMTFHPWGFQPVGSATVAATTSFAGRIADMRSSSVSMVVNPDCSATLEWTAQISGQTARGTVKYIVLDNGTELIGVATEDSRGLPIEIESHKRISIIPAAPGR